MKNMKTGVEYATVWQKYPMEMCWNRIFVSWRPQGGKPMPDGGGKQIIVREGNINTPTTVGG